MAFTKWLPSVSSTGGKRFWLAILSIIGVISFSALNGTPLDVGSTSFGAFLISCRPRDYSSSSELSSSPVA
jgi:hypothetical protein